MQLFLQIAWPDGSVVRLPAGERVEQELHALIKEAILKRGVGFFRSEAHVAQDIEDGIFDALETFKASIRPREIQ